MTVAERNTKEIALASLLELLACSPQVPSALEDLGQQYQLPFQPGFGICLQMQTLCNTGMLTLGLK